MGVQMSWKKWLILWLFLHIFDCHSTFIVLNKYGAEWEFWPWTRFIFAKWGTAGMIALKIIYLYILCAFIWRIAKIEPAKTTQWWIKLTLIILVILLFFVVGQNYYYAFWY